MEEKKIKKLYYSISEVSQITGLKKYILRYWETEFPDLRPGKNRAGNRIYRLNDIRTIFLIKKLLYQDKYTIEGAKKRLKELKKQKDPQLELSFEELRREDMLREIRKDLRDLLNFLDNKQPELMDTTGEGERPLSEDVSSSVEKLREAEMPREKLVAKSKSQPEPPDLFLLEQKNDTESASETPAAKFTIASEMEEPQQEEPEAIDINNPEENDQAEAADSPAATAMDMELPASPPADSDASEILAMEAESPEPVSDDIPEALQNGIENSMETESEGTDLFAPLNEDTIPAEPEAQEAPASAVEDRPLQDDQDEKRSDTEKEPPIDPTDAWDDPDQLSK